MVRPRFRSSSASDASTKLTISAPIRISDPLTPTPSSSSPAPSASFPTPSPSSTAPSSSSTQPGNNVINTDVLSTDEVIKHTSDSHQSDTAVDKKSEPSSNLVPEPAPKDKDTASSPGKNTETDSSLAHSETRSETTNSEPPHFACPSCKQPFKRASSAGSRIPATVPEDTVPRGSHVCPSVEDRLDKLTGQVKELAKENRELKLEIIKIYSILCQKGQAVVNSEPGPNTLVILTSIPLTFHFWFGNVRNTHSFLTQIVF